MYIKYTKVYYPNTEVGEIMQLRLLRIDETMLPFMNGDGLEDVPGNMAPNTQLRKM